MGKNKPNPKKQHEKCSTCCCCEKKATTTCRACGECLCSSCSLEFGGMCAGCFSTYEYPAERDELWLKE